MYFLKNFDNSFSCLVFFEIVVGDSRCSPTELSNGEVQYDMDPIDGKYPLGTTANYSCNRGYKLYGGTRRCWVGENRVMWFWGTVACVPGK